MIKAPTTFVGTAVAVTAITFAIALGVWFLHTLFENIVSTPRTIGNAIISPYGHQMHSLLTHCFDSLHVNAAGNNIKAINPCVDITLLGREKGITLNVDLISANILLSNNKQNDSIVLPKFSDNIKFILPVKIQVNKTNVELSNKMKWNIENLDLRSQGQKAIALKAQNVSGNFIKENANVSVNANFERALLKLNAKIKTKNDSINLSANAPKNDLGKLNTNIEVSVKDPKKWSPIKIPDKVPLIGKINAHAKANIDVTKKQTNFSAILKTKVGAFWPLMAQNITLKINGNKDSANVNLLLNNDEGGSINLSGNIDSKMNAKLKGSVKNTSAKFGPQMMPMDLEIKRAELHNKKITAFIETRQGSLIDANIDFKDSLFLTFTGDISQYEPWALDWTHGNLTLNARPQFYGAFDGHSLKILSKIYAVQNAYHMCADSLQVLLDLNTKGIDFSNGIIYTPNETFDFYGDVKWKHAQPHTSWNVTQRSGGNANAYINISDSIAIDATANQVVFATIPFSDIKFGRNIDGKISGVWHHDFDDRRGKIDVSIDGELDAFKASLSATVREEGDTVFVDKFSAIHGKNSAMAMGAFLLPDSTQELKSAGILPVKLLFANVSSNDFSIPLLLETLNDSTLTSGMLNGSISYKQGDKLTGSLDFFNLKFRKIPPELFNVKKLNVFAENDKIEINSYLDIGSGGWTGNTQVIINNIFSDKRHISFSHGSDNGGTIWAEGFINNDLIFNGTLNANGSWFIPGTMSEIKNTNLHVDVSANIKDRLKGITADISLDSAIFEPPKTKLQFPFYMKGHIENGLVDIYEGKTQNDIGEVILGSLQFNLNNMKLMGIDVHSDKYSITKGNHKLTFKNIQSHMIDNETELSITANIPNITYTLNDESLGKAEAIARGNIGFSLPHKRDGIIKNSIINGNISIDKMVYYRNFDVEITPSALNKYLTMFNNFISKLRKKNPGEEKLSIVSPINLALHISDSQMDSVAVVTPFATFPLTADLWIFGNTARPLLRGDITNTGNGFIGIKNIYEFSLNSFLISWNDVPWQNGTIDVSSSQELPYCSETNDKDKETCPVNFDLQGSITNLQAVPSSNCGTESSTAAIYYNILLGCIAEENGEEADWNKLAGKALGKVISSTANKTLGGDYIGDIEMKVMLFENNSTNEKDSSYFKVPVSLNRWVKNLSLIFGYTQDQSENPTYDQSLQFGVNYTLPVFQEEEFSHKNHLSPTLSLNGVLTSKQYLTNTGTETNESRLEKNVGVNYVYRFWNPCLLGIGRCEGMQIENNKQNKKEPEAQK